MAVGQWNVKMVISVHLKVALCFFHSPLTATCHLNINDNAIETLAFMRQNLQLLTSVQVVPLWPAWLSQRIAQCCGNDKFSKHAGSVCFLISWQHLHCCQRIHGFTFLSIDGAGSYRSENLGNAKRRYLIFVCRFTGRVFAAGSQAPWAPGARPGLTFGAFVLPENFKTLHSNFHVCRNFQRTKMKYILQSFSRNVPFEFFFDLLVIISL